MLLSEPDFGLYLHWPFCAAKCPYCDFNSHVSATIDEARWQAAYLREIERLGAETEGRILRSVYFGGGTPSLMSPDLVDALLGKIRAVWAWANDVEITLEANPSSVEAGRFAGYRAAGVSRVSLGVQALNDRDLKRLGRLHDAGEARAALEIARGAFDRVSFDLIYGRQDQSVEAWRAELGEALAWAPSHLSLYQLTIEEGTPFAARQAAGGLRGLPDEDVSAELYEVTQGMCEAAGLPAYEVSNHAREGAESQHNLLYWRGQDYGGIGPGAHGRLTLDGGRFATETPLLPMAWLEAVEQNGRGERLRAPLSEEEIREERLMMGLRMRDGLPLAGLEPYAASIARMEEIGMVARTDGQLRLTRAGRPLLNAVLRELIA